MINSCECVNICGSYIIITDWIIDRILIFIFSVCPIVVALAISSIDLWGYFNLAFIFSLIFLLACRCSLWFWYRYFYLCLRFVFLEIVFQWINFLKLHSERKVFTTCKQYRLVYGDKLGCVQKIWSMKNNSYYVSIFWVLVDGRKSVDLNDSKENILVERYMAYYTLLSQYCFLFFLRGVNLHGLPFLMLLTRCVILL